MDMVVCFKMCFNCLVYYLLTKLGLYMYLVSQFIALYSFLAQFTITSSYVLIVLSTLRILYYMLSYKPACNLINQFWLHRSWNFAFQHREKLTNRSWITKCCSQFYVSEVLRNSGGKLLNKWKFKEVFWCLSFTCVLARVLSKLFYTFLSYFY